MKNFDENSKKKRASNMLFVSYSDWCLFLRSNLIYTHKKLSFEDIYRSSGRKIPYFCEIR